MPFCLACVMAAMLTLPVGMLGEAMALAGEGGSGRSGRSGGGGRSGRSNRSSQRDSDDTTSKNESKRDQEGQETETLESEANDPQAPDPGEPAASESDGLSALLQSPTEDDSGVGEQDYAKLAAALSATRTEEQEIFYYNCRNLPAAEMAKILEQFISSSGTVAASEESETIVISDVPSQLAKLQPMCVMLDKRSPQILVRAHIVELSLESDFEKELDLSFIKVRPNDMSWIRQLMVSLPTPGASPNEGVGGLFNINPVQRYRDGGAKQDSLLAFFRFLETRGKARILSAPNITLRRGVEGSILTGEEVPILQQTVVSGSISTSTVFKSVGIKLRVTPHMIVGDTVSLTINPEVSAVTGFAPAGDGITNPVISVRKANTRLVARNNELISMGGLLRTQKRTTKRRVPVLGSLPGIGQAFRSTRVEMEKTQLLILLHIRVLDDGAPKIHRPESDMEISETEIERMQAVWDERWDLRHDLDLIKSDGKP